MDNQSQYSEEIDIVEYIKVACKRWKMVTAIVFVSMLFAGISSLRKPKIYEAYATFFPIEYEDSQSTDVAKRQIGIENLIISVLESRKMANRVIEQLDLKHAWEIKVTTNAEKKLKSMTKITPEKNDLIRLSVRDKSPELLAKIANAYVDNLDYFNREFEVSAQRKIVQVIDRAVVPEQRMSRGTIKNTLLAGVASLVFSLFLAFFLEFMQKNRILARLKEK